MHLGKREIIRGQETSGVHQITSDFLPVTAHACFWKLHRLAALSDS
jgi:hypothetical protein